MREQVDECSAEDGGEPPRCISPSNPLAFPRPDGRTARAGPDFEIFWRIALAWAPSRSSHVHFPPATGPLGGPMDARGRGSNPVAGWRHAVAFMVAPCRQDPPRAALIQRTQRHQLAHRRRRAAGGPDDLEPGMLAAHLLHHPLKSPISPSPSPLPSLIHHHPPPPAHPQPTTEKMDACDFFGRVA